MVDEEVGLMLKIIKKKIDMFDLLKIIEYLLLKNYGVYYVCVILESDIKFSYFLKERYFVYGVVC